MPWITLILLGIIIGSNNLAVALALGALGQISRLWRIVLIFGLFEFFIPLVGIALGYAVRRSDPLTLAITISLFSMTFTWIGIRLGDASRRNWERPTHVAAGILLVLLAFAQSQNWI